MNGTKAPQTKRVFDIAASLLLLILLLPFMLLISLILKMDSQGKVIFRQTRIGKHGNRFKIWKFRTMVSGAETIGPGLTAHNDVRITRFGRVLRRSSLDELPQLVNVLLGQMSLVGPRPEIPEIVKQYTHDQRRVLSVKPGITGLSQINGRDDLPLDVKLDYELRYIKDYSLILDLKILFKTYRAIISGRGNRF